MVYNSLNVSAKDSLMGELSKLSIPSSLPQTLSNGVSQGGFIPHFLQVGNITGGGKKSIQLHSSITKREGDETVTFQ